ncbi:MAG: hypothetical protein ACHQRJ_07620 [Alphaproteobacteria bacterium]
MLTLHAVELLNILQITLGLEFKVRGKSGALPTQLAESLQKGASKFQEFAESLELPVTAATARNMLATCTSSEELHRALLQIGNTLFMELDNRKFFGPAGRYVKYFEEPKLFGDAVFDRFPSANEDIYESGMCLALERGTACVMHLMRVLEVALAALAKAVGVINQSDWGAYLRKIDGELSARAKSAGARTPDEQFYSEAASNFDHVRRAFRNPTMHPEKSYSPARAEEILVATKSFMTHLASRLSE